MQTLVERLRRDFGRLTFGELIQDREAAALELERLTQELNRIYRAQIAQVGQAPMRQSGNARRSSPSAKFPAASAALGSRALLRLRDVCAMVCLSRSSIYAGIAAGNFPSALRIGVRAVRWRAGDIEAWLSAKEVTLA